jgi:nitrous oxide reductase accessory protein NosL
MPPHGKESIMKWISIIVLLAVLITGAGMVLAKNDDSKQHPSCKYCGMDREKFGHSRMLIEYEDGTSTGTCSIHCTSIELALTIEKTPRSIMVGDYGSKKLIDAEKAAWVVGGAKQGVMTRRAKWAFGRLDDAMAFVKENGGTVTTFDEAMKAAYEDMYQDTKMVREKRKMKRTGREHQHPK